MYRGMGMPGWNVPTTGPADALTPENEKQALENQLSALQAELDAVRKRLDEVSGRATAPQG